MDRLRPRRVFPSRRPVSQRRPSGYPPQVISRVELIKVGQLGERHQERQIAITRDALVRSGTPGEDKSSGAALVRLADAAPAGEQPLPRPGRDDATALAPLRVRGIVQIEATRAKE